MGTGRKFTGELPTKSYEEHVMTNFQDIYQHSYPVSPDGNPFVQNDLGRYTQNHPVPPDDVAERKAYLVGSGIASLLAAAYLIRDARCWGEHHHPRGNVRTRRRVRRSRGYGERLHRSRWS
ncbi:myosin-crossreactive antigen [Cutibacterium acnes JCM 18918]|nr:myosin-crossreactive antigen [Cutibacterium acnes JCM 18918]